MGKQIKKKIVAFLLVINIFVAPVFAFEVPNIDTSKFPVVLFGDYLEYRTDTQQVITKGNSYITYQDMKISADTIQANIETEDIFAQGNIDFWRGYDQTTGDFMVYNVRTGEGWMRDATVRTNRNFFRATEVKLSPRRSIAHNIMQTTCDHTENPHYSIRAEKIDTTPGHHMTMEGLRLKWKNRRLLSQARNVSDLRRTERFFRTRQGVSQIDGFYFKFITDLEINDNVTGRFNLDYFEQRGQGFGFDGTWTTARRGSGSIYMYFLDEHRRNRSNAQINFTHNYRFDTGSSLNTSINYSQDKRPGIPENQDLTVQMNYRPVLTFMNMNITANKYFDLAGDRDNRTISYQILNRLPEINFSFPAYTMPFMPVNVNFSGMYGSYEEGTLDNLKSTEKKETRFNFTTPTIEVHPRSNLTPSYNFHKNFYSGGIERENTTTMLRANHKFSDTTSLEMNYNLAKSKGRSPVQFDSFTSTDVLSTRLRFSENNWTLNPLNFNYNRVRRRLEQVYVDYSRRSDRDAYKTWEFFVRQDFLPEDDPFSQMSFAKFDMGNFNTRYRMATNLWSFDTSITVPHRYRRISNTSFNYRANIRPLWQVRTSGNYNNITQKFSPLTIGITRDLHCWEVKAEYNHSREEFWLEFYLKASPQDSGRFRYGFDENRLQARIAAYDQITQRYEGMGY